MNGGILQIAFHFSHSEFYGGNEIMELHLIIYDIETIKMFL